MRLKAKKLLPSGTIIDFQMDFTHESGPGIDTQFPKNAVDMLLRGVD